MRENTLMRIAGLKLKKMNLNKITSNGKTNIIDCKGFKVGYYDLKVCK